MLPYDYHWGKQHCLHHWMHLWIGTVGNVLLCCGILNWRRGAWWTIGCVLLGYPLLPYDYHTYLGMREAKLSSSLNALVDWVCWQCPPLLWRT
jgi:hypothetical protein